MRIGVHGKEIKGESIRFLEEVFDQLVEHKVQLSVSEKFQRFLKAPVFKKFKFKTFSSSGQVKNLDFFLSLGGDGTLLESVTYVGRSEVPILGINTGRLGFLATISRANTSDALEHLFNRNYKIEARTVLRLETDQQLFKGQNFALNDFTIMKKDTSSMITVHVYVDGELLNSYWSDGIIVSTPTGSTGYSLSCGGPLLYPKSESFVITPVSPHTLTARPIVLSDASEITFRVEGRIKKFLISLDSRFETIDGSVKLKVKKESFKVKLVQTPDYDYFATLRQKLNWGLDIRN
ncbi:MAG: NAD kinase [Flammeovirgaceae bacterium]|nr:NAD kinase [Flammeovirgaceae bacterium]